MSARRPWKLYLLALLGIGLVAAVWFYRGGEKSDNSSQWAMPETPASTGNVKDPFPQTRKVLTPEEIRNGEWGPETSTTPEEEKKSENPEAQK